MKKNRCKSTRKIVVAVGKWLNFRYLIIHDTWLGHFIAIT